MKLLPANKYPKFAKLLSTNARFANFSLLAAIAIAAAGLVIVSGLFFGRAQIFAPQKSVGTPEPHSDALGEREAESLRRQESLLRGLPFQQALESMQAQLTQVSSPTKLGKSGILTITDSGIIKPTDHNQTQGGIGTDVSRIGKIWGSFMDLKDDVSINGKLDLSGKLTANGVVVLGNNDGDTIEVGGRFTSNLVPSQTNAVDIGTTSLRWRTGYFVNSIIVGSGTTTITDTGITTTGGSSTSITSSLLNLVSTGTLQLDTSTNNTNILLLSGTGNVGIGSTAPGYKLDVSGTGHYTGAVTFDSSISVSDLSCSDCLDFDSFEDSLDMDADTSINGDYSLILRAGAGAVQNSTSGSNDVQIVAEDRLDLYAASYSLTTSGNSVDILSAGRIDLSARGTLTLDTSQNNTNILLKAPGRGVSISPPALPPFPAM